MSDKEAALRELLEGTFLFRGAPQAAAAALADRRILRRSAAKGEVIYDPRHFQRCLGVVVQGAVRVNKGELLMSVLRRGDLFGAAALFNDRPDYATTLTARSPCALVLLPQDLVEELMGRWPQVGRNYVAYLSERIRFLSAKIDALTAGPALRKAAQYLLSRQDGETAELDCSITDLACRLGVSRASLYRALDGLEAAGGIARKGRRVRILDQTALQEL